MATRDEEPRETSGVTTTLILRYVEARGGPQAVADTIAAARVPFTVEELDQASHWIGYDTRIRLFEAATAVLGDPGTAFGIGATALKHGLHHAIVPLLRAFGSPREVYRQLPRAVPKFTTTSTMDLVECGRHEATIHYRLHEGYTHSRLDCAYAQGLFAAVPVIFGMPPARVRHTECESDGHPVCVYQVTWSGRRRWWSRAGKDEVGLAALRVQLEEFQDAAADLVSSDNLEDILERIVSRAVAAILAPAYLLVLDRADGPPLVRHQGLDPDQADALAQRLVAGESLGSSAVVVDIASSRRDHGRLAAIYGTGHRPLEGDHSLLQAYARHAAAALDLLTALEGSRLEQSRTAALLGLAHELATAESAADIAAVIAREAPGITDCSAVGVLFWDPEAGALEVVASSGLPEDARASIVGTPFRADCTPEIIKLLTQHSPQMVGQQNASREVAAVMRLLGSANLVVAPMLAGDTLLGAAVAGWTTARTPAAQQRILARLSGVADQAAAALQNARLLSTVRRQAHHDSLTGLANRVEFSQRLDEVLAEEQDGWTTVLFCDLDNFKAVNDELGHGAGDELLRQVADRLREAIGSEHTVARLGGDEFAVAMRVEDERAAAAAGRRCVEAVSAPFRIDGNELRMTMSVGVALHRGPEGRGERLLAASDRAMYQAKQRGRNQVALATDATEGAPGPSLQAELRTALQEGQLRMHLQPVVDVSAPGLARVVGAEALVRWQHPRLGLLSPAAFLTLAEETGHITAIDLWVLEAACRWLAATPPAGPKPLHVAVNLAGRTLVDPRFLATVRGALRRHGLAPGQLVLEIVESRSLVDLPGVVERLAELRQLGVRVSLDDFGTGYSTLAWLKNLPVDQIKIDRSFITALPGTASVALVRGVLALAKELGVEVVAEGVELFEQLEALRSADCHLVQGYLIGRPEPEPSLETRRVGVGATA